MKSFISKDDIEQSLLQRLVALDWKRIECDPAVGQQFRGKDSSGKSTRFADAIKHEFKSPNYSTRWSDIIELK